MWRAAVAAAESGQWVGWSRIEVEGEAVPPASLPPAEETASLCRGLAVYLEQLSVEERVRVTARVARVLDAVHANTDLRPFSRLGLVPDNDRDSIWQAVLRILVGRDRQGSDPGAWPDYVAYLPASSRVRWREQLGSLEISEELRGQIERVLASDAPPVPSGAAATDSAKAAADDAAWPSRLAASAPAPGRALPDEPAAEGPESGRTAVLVAGRDLPLPMGAAVSAARSAAAGGGAADKTAQGAPGRTISMRSISALTHGDAGRAAAAAAKQAAAQSEAAGRSDSGSSKRMVAEPVVAPGAAAPRSAKTTDELPPIEALGARASQIAVESSEMPAAGQAGPMELVGGYAGRPLPAFARALLFLTGLIVIVAAVRLALRFLLGLRREGRVRLDGGQVVVESAHYMLGKQMRHVRRTFGPEGLLSVAREVRYPSLFLFVGMFALTIGALTGTIAYLDGTLAGFEDWIRTGLLLILGGLVVDFVFTVIAVTRPGRTTLSLTFAPRTTVRILGVEQARAEAFLDLLARRANQTG